MTESITTSAKPFRLQFGLRSMLILTAIIAVLAWWYVRIPAGTVNEWQTGWVQPGMTKSTVRRLIGRPYRELTSSPVPTVSIWYYNVVPSVSDRTLVIEFDPKTGVVADVQVSVTELPIVQIPNSLQ